MRPSPFNDCSGVTLIELLVTGSIVIVVLTSLFALTLNRTKQQNADYQKLQAQLTAESVADLIASLDSGAFSNLVAQGAASTSLCTPSGCSAAFDTSAAGAPGWLTVWLGKSNVTKITALIYIGDLATATYALVAPPIDLTQHDVMLVVSASFQRNTGAALETVQWTKQIKRD